MRALFPREKIILLLTSLCALTYVLVVVIFKPLQEHIQDFDEQITASEERLLKSNAMIKTLGSLDSDYAKLVSIFGKSSSQGAEASAVVSQLELAANNANIRISNMQPQRAVEQGYLISYPVDIVIEGTWKAITKFLYLIQAPENMLNVNQMSIEKYSDATVSLRGHLVLSRMRVAQ